MYQRQERPCTRMNATISSSITVNCRLSNLKVERWWRIVTPWQPCHHVHRDPAPGCVILISLLRLYSPSKPCRFQNIPQDVSKMRICSAKKREYRSAHVVPCPFVQAHYTTLISPNVHKWFVLRKPPAFKKFRCWNYPSEVLKRLNT